MLFLKQSTNVTVNIGPFIDDTDGKTAETGLTEHPADILLAKNGGDFAAKNEGTNCSHDNLGWYHCPLDDTDTNTLGVLQLHCHEAGFLPVFHEFMVLPANVYNSLVLGSASDLLDVSVVQLNGGAQSLTDLKDFADDGYDPATNKVQGVVLTDTATAVTNDVGITQAAADKAWGTAARALTDKAGFALSNAGVDAILDEVVDANAPANANSLRETVNVIAAATAGKLSGGGTATLKFRDLGDTKDRITATVDADGNRTATTPDGT